PAFVARPFLNQQFVLQSADRGFQPGNQSKCRFSWWQLYSCNATVPREVKSNNRNLAVNRPQVRWDGCSWRSLLWSCACLFEACDKTKTESGPSAFLFAEGLSFRFEAVLSLCITIPMAGAGFPALSA